MKSKVLLILIFAFVHTAGFSQAGDGIARIRGQVNSIEKSLKNYERKVKDVEGLSLEGTRATFYVSKAGLKKIKAEIYGESYNSTVQIYYSAGVPIFIYQRFNKYNMPIAATRAPKITSVEETRAYYDDKRLIRLLNGKTEIKASDAKFEESERDLNYLSTKLYEAYKE